MNVEVVFLPPIATDLPSKLCVVIDVLRATSTMVSMFEAGTRRVTLAESIPAALAHAQRCGERPLVCGESGGLPPAGFDLGNSPREFHAGTVQGRDLCFCTSNGTRAMQQVTQSPVVLGGSLLNASAVARVAVEEARQKGLGIAFICSGDYLGSKFAIDDAFTAGYLATLLQRESAGAEVALEESAVAAVRLYRSYLPEAGGSDREAAPPREAILRAFWESHNAEVLSRVGLAEDVEYCAQVDISSKVPRLRMEEGMLVLV
ncbi:MAG: 2-phosphosulfolactate phosphatase [Chloroflexi bacterium]|nr:2-phosphosulfolactate phosphatase [Chloroflexota bacterium]